jgi:predicted AAA+ superfamily ATPase
MKKRYLSKEIAADLKDKMVFLGGPRQVGKTTFAREAISPRYKKAAYFNWDYAPDRKNVAKSIFPAEADLIVLDEIHKYKKWKNLVKGLYDTQRGRFSIFVTGSARLDIFHKGGDSLQGRYHYYRMHPFSLAEVLGISNQIKPGEELRFSSRDDVGRILHELLAFGGFPEPFLARDEKVLRRWHRERLERLFREDIRDTETIKDLGSLELLGSMLPERAAGRLSTNALREDLEVSFKAVANWLNLLERFYYLYRIYPFSSKRIRSLKKEPKLYLWDWSEITDVPRRLENLVAGHLFKMAHYLHDAEGYLINLHYLRDVDGREVDFLVTQGQQPWFAVEVKTEDREISRNLLYFGERLRIPYLYQVILSPGIDQQIGQVRLISADKFLAGLV